jgi:S-adenosylmethionine hydrolase
MRPIVLATDYSESGSYVGQLKSAIYKVAPHAQVIDLIHDLPVFNPKASAYLLASYLDYIPENSIVVGVVDPGVGSNREPIILEGNGYTFIGPNNGLFSIVAKKLSNYKLSEIRLSKEPSSKTFHGRDIFAPVAAQIAVQLKTNLESMLIEKLIGFEWPEELSEVIYIDHFGNVTCGITLDQINTNLTIKIKEVELSYAKTFHAVKSGESFWYRNANGMLEISAREQSVSEALNLKVGDVVALLN